MTKIENGSTTTTGAKVKETYLNREDSKVVVELEKVRDYDEILKEFKSTLKDGQFFDKLRWSLQNPDEIDYSDYCDSEGKLTEIDFRYEEYNTNDCFICNFDLDENQKNLMIEYLKSTSNGLATEIICDLDDDETDEEYVCENILYINELTFKYNDYFGEIVVDDENEIYKYKYDVVRTMVDED